MVGLSRVAVGLVAATLARATTMETYIKAPVYECAEGCTQAIHNVQFSSVNVSVGYYGYCVSDDAVTSLAICMKEHCSMESNLAEWTLQKYNCEHYGQLIMPSWEEANAKINESNILRNVNIFDTSVTMYNSTIQVDDASFQAGYDTLRAWDYVFARHHAFGWSMYIMVSMMLLLGLMQRAFRVFYSRHYYPSSSTKSPISKLLTIYEKYLGSPALLGCRHVQPLGWSQLPTRIESLFIFTYVLVNILFCCVGYPRIWNQNLYWPDAENTQISRYVADRTGIISFYNMPLLFVLAGRNDILLWLTGWSFNSMNLFHRWVGKVATAQAFVHTVCWAYQYWGENAEQWKEEYWATGSIGMLTMALLLPLSVYPIRQKIYEFFLATHFVLALVTLIMLFYHVKIYDGAYDSFLWVCVGVWAFERFARIVRMIVFSHRAILSRKPNTVATMTSDDHGLIRLTVTVPSITKPKPGEHYYIYTPNQITFWENHPFSLAGWVVEGKSTQLSFLMAPQKGVTRKLQRLLSKTSSGTSDMRLFIEGPYGHAEDLRHYDQLVFIAGGSGITAILPYLYEITCKPNKFQATRIQVIWSVKSLNYASDVLSHELAPILNATKTEVRIHMTADEEASAGTTNPTMPTLLGEPPIGEPTAEAENVKSTGGGEEIQPHMDDEMAAAALEDKADSVAGSSASQFEARAGRPVMLDALQTSLKGLGENDKLGLMACGPPTMLDDLRKAVCDAYGDGKGQVHANRLTYMEEQFNW